jgi:hypothetical protein
MLRSVLSGLLVLALAACASNGEIGFSGHPLDCAIGVGHSDCAPGTPGAARYERDGNTVAQDSAAMLGAFQPRAVTIPSPPSAQLASFETRITGEFTGWTGSSIYRTDDGAVWKQAVYYYHYHYAFSPRVLIYTTSAGAKMHVIDDDSAEDVLVARLN